MFSLLLKKALPFALTFAAGAALGGPTWPSGAAGRKGEAAVTRTYDFGPRCRMRRQLLVAETKPLAIHSEPLAWLPRDAEWLKEGESTARVSVTFGADGTVHDVAPLALSLRARGEDLVETKVAWEAAERAARRIRFTPETVDGVPVTVTREVRVRFTTF